MTLIDVERRVKKLVEWMAGQLPPEARVECRRVDRSGPPRGLYVENQVDCVYLFRIESPDGKREIEVTERALEEFAPSHIAAELGGITADAVPPGYRTRITMEQGALASRLVPRLT